MIELSAIERLGVGLQRPECVLANHSGRLFSADWRGGVAVMEANGKQWCLLARDAPIELRPNGICLMPDRSVLVAHLGADDGGVYRIDEDGHTSPFCIEVDGQALPPSNYVHRDRMGRVWITVSTRTVPRSAAYNAAVADGFVVLVDDTGARIVADNLGYTNECLVDPSGHYLYVNETFSRRLCRFKIKANGELGNKEIVTVFDAGVFPDGLCFDHSGNIWITSIVSNRVIRIDTGGAQELVIDDSNPQHIAWVEDAYLTGTMGRPHLDKAVGRKLKNISSLAFGGSDLQTAFLGCLLDDCIYTYRSPVAGHPPSHWLFEGPRQFDHNCTATADAKGRT